MATVLELQTMRAALVAARSTGTLRTVFNSGGTRREVEYKSDTEMAAAIAAIDREIATASGTKPRRFLPSFQDGF
ncbi:phage head-tail joining protein [Hoeflea sp. Naph1]|uniref:phage head-tail joining protein n=1 Tax=Hoeflea sp. Naph1 TaxID=3388653 RepID=UPI00398FD232